MELVEQVHQGLRSHRRRRAWGAGRGLEEEEPPAGGKNVGRLLHDLAQLNLREPEHERRGEPADALALDIERAQGTTGLGRPRGVRMVRRQARHRQACIGQAAGQDEHDGRPRPFTDHRHRGWRGRCGRGLCLSLVAELPLQRRRQVRMAGGELRLEHLAVLGSQVIAHLAHQPLAHGADLADGEEERAARQQVERVAQQCEFQAYVRAGQRVNPQARTHPFVPPAGAGRPGARPTRPRRHRTRADSGCAAGCGRSRC